MSLIEVPALSEDFGRIEYELQLQLGAPRLVVSKCFELSSPHISAQFKTFCKSMNPQNIVDVYVPTSQLQQQIDEIGSKGIRVDPEKGFHFTVGTLNVNRSDKQIDVVRLSIALGRTLNYQQSKSIKSEDSEFIESAPKSDDLKSGFHSLCTSNEGDYYVFNSAQILTRNLVQFKGRENLNPATEEDNICDQCGQEKAEIWCINDAAKLCAKCDEELHKDKISQNHKRISLSEARSMIEYCPVHPDQRVEYYCPQCNCPVCYRCKMTGSHSKGPAATHPLVQINVAYNKSLEESAQENPMLTRRKKIIREKIKDADKKMELVTQNVDEIVNEINRLAQAAIDRAYELAGQKALIIRSTKTELERKQKEIDDLSSFIENQKEHSSPLAFLRTFDRYGLIIGSLQEANDLPPELKVEADLCLFGSLNVGTTDKQPDQSNLNQSQSQPQSRSIKKQGSPKKSQNNNNNNNNRQFQQTLHENYYDNDDDYDENADDDEDNQASSATLADNDNMQQRDAGYSDITSNKQKQNQNQRQQNPSQSQKKSNKQSLKRKSDAGPEYTSIIALAQRREQKNKARGLELTFQPFSGTQIINSTALCTALYLCFPFKAQPQTHLLFSTERDGRLIRKMHEMIDGIGITAVLVKKGEFVFGGFAAAKWRNDGEPFGEGSSSFLFSLSQDAFIPYKPRINEPCHLYATEDSLTFGKYDLILEDNFDRCSAVIENSYGIGFTQGSTEAQTFLAGQPVFKADIVEVWGFFTIEQQ